MGAKYPFKANADAAVAMRRIRIVTAATPERFSDDKIGIGLSNMFLRNDNPRRKRESKARGLAECRK